MDDTLVQDCDADTEFSLHLESINYSAEQIDNMFCGELLDEANLDDIAIWMKQAEEAVSILRLIQKSLSVAAAEKMDTKVVNIDGVGSLEKSRGSQHAEWDTENLLPVVLAKAVDDRKFDKDTGEYEREGEAVMRVLNECARFSWRLGKQPSGSFTGTSLRRLGIDPEEYCTTSHRPYTARFVK